MYIVLGVISLAVLVVVILYFLVVRIVVNIFMNISITTARETSPDVGGEDVTFNARDGITLHGYFIPGKNAQGKTVVFCHEVGAGWGSWHKYASFIPENGYNLFSFDFRGHGMTNSNGYSPNQWISQYEIHDLIGAISYLKTRHDVDTDKLAFFGISRGAGAAICAASELGDVRAVVCDSAFSSYETLLDYILRWTSVYLPCNRLPDCMNNMLATHSIWFAAIKAGHELPRMEKHLKKLKSLPVLFIHGQRDNYIPAAQAQRLYDMAKGPKDLWIVPKARHNEAVLVEPVEYREKILSFLDTYVG